MDKESANVDMDKESANVVHLARLLYYACGQNGPFHKDRTHLVNVFKELRIADEDSRSSEMDTGA